MLARYVPAGGRMLDPFAGSGTTLVQALESGHDATGIDVAAFNCLLMRVKTAQYNEFVLEHEIRDALARLGSVDSALQGLSPGRGYIGRWFAPRAARQLLAFRSIVTEYAHADVLRLVLARAARSARLTTHFDLDFPREPQTGPYWCHKHKRECRPVDRAGHFIRRYGLDTLTRIKAFARVRGRGVEAEVIHGDARELELDRQFDAVVTSPPYRGLIDYHEQHRYAYELLDLDDCRELEVGAAAAGTSKRALVAYQDGIVGVLLNVREALRPGAPVAIVVNDRRDLYPEILERAGLALEERLRRHVNPAHGPSRGRVLRGRSGRARLAPGARRRERPEAARGPGERGRSGQRDRAPVRRDRTVRVHVQLRDPHAPD
jgi:hypothetical protein